MRRYYTELGNNTSKRREYTLHRVGKLGHGETMHDIRRMYCEVTRIFDIAEVIRYAQRK